MALYYGPIYQDSEYDATSDSEEDIIGWKPPKRARKKKIRKPVHPPLWQNDDSVISIHLLNDDCLEEIFSDLSMVES